MTGIIKVDDLKDAGGNSIISSNGSGTFTYTFNAGSIAQAALAADIIDGTKLADDAINSEHYTDGSIDTAHIGADQITNAKIADDSIDSEHYANASIDTAHIANAQITTALIADDAVTEAKMAANSVDSQAYVDGSIDTVHIGATQVTGAKLAADVISAQTALADIPATTDEFLVSDAGTLKRIDAGFVSNYPIFHLYKAGTTSFANDTTTQLVPTSVVRNDDSVYNTSNGRFTVQANQDGMYFFYGGFRIDNYDPNRCSAVFFVNGSELSHTMHEHSPQGDLTSRRPTIHATAFAQLSATDYVTFHGHQGSGSTDTVINAVFCGFKIGG